MLRLDLIEEENWQLVATIIHPQNRNIWLFSQIQSPIFFFTVLITTLLFHSILSTGTHVHDIAVYQTWTSHKLPEVFSKYISSYYERLATK